MERLHTFSTAAAIVLDHLGRWLRITEEEVREFPKCAILYLDKH